MLTLSVKIRKKFGKKVKNIKKAGILPGVLYGPRLKGNQHLEINLKEFEKVYKEAGESSLISLDIEEKKIPVLIHDLQKDSLTGEFIHVDFYQPKLEKEIEVKIPLIFESEAPAVKELGGTFIKHISEVRVKALPQNLPHGIKINIGGLKTFEDTVLIKDLVAPEGVKILNNPGEIIASVVSPEKVEEELEKPIEEKVEEIEKVVTEKKVMEEVEKAAEETSEK